MFTYLISATMGEPEGSIDFFISYRGEQTPWALWINWVLRSAGYSTRLMDEFRVGNTWTNSMREAANECRRLIPLYSTDYWRSGACVEEFDSYWHRHLKDSGARFILPLKIQECSVPHMHAVLLSKSLLNLERDSARAAILKVLEGISAGASQGTPSAKSFNEPEPLFPGKASVLLPVAEWPETAPAFKWPLADHGDARDAFAKLVTRAAPHKVLLIRGESETGKSHLTNQFLGNAKRRIPNARAGRLDFKGTSDLDAALSEFANQLGLTAPSNGALYVRLNAVFRQLEVDPKPTLLIFDTCELAGEADRWLREFLFPSLLRYPWLRVVAAGQRLQGAQSEVWAEDACVVPLRKPTAQEWLDYGLENKRSVTLDFVQQAHELCEGRATVLAQLLGPAA
jgi:hypothetical protein